MAMTRRQCLAETATAAAGLVLGTRVGRGEEATSRPGRSKDLRLAMCDWSMGRMDSSAFGLAKEIGLQGVQVSLGTAANGMWLRRREIQEQYRQAIRESGLAICSLAIAELNNVPLMSEPRAAVWVADAIEVAREMKVARILLAFFGKGELREENETDMRRVTEVLQELAPRAEKAGVVLAIESYLSAEGHLKILDAVKSKAVQVYYDFYNSHVTKGYDFAREVRLLGRDRICEVHLKEGRHLLGAGQLDWPGVAAVLREIGYEGWIVLETSSPSGDMAADTRRNAAYARKLFAA